MERGEWKRERREKGGGEEKEKEETAFPELIARSRCTVALRIHRDKARRPRRDSRNYRHYRLGVVADIRPSRTAPLLSCRFGSPLINE